MNNSMFSVCDRYWDEKEQKFRHADIVQSMKCCVNSCDTPINFCNTECVKMHGKGNSKYNSCIEQCNDINESCREMCKLSSRHWGIDNPMSKCKRNKKCHYVDGVLLCKRGDEKDLIDCCVHGCTPSSGIECVSYCKYLKELLFRNSNKESSIRNVGDKNFKVNSVEYNNRLPLLFMSIFFVVLVIFVISKFNIIN